LNRFWLILHLLGFTMWLGGGLASMFAGISAKHEDRAGIGAIARAQSAIWKTVIGPGALLAVLSGLILTVQVGGRSGDMAGFNVWLLVMQGTGIVGALLVLFIAVPTAARLSRLDPAGPNAAYYDELRRRQKIVGMVTGTLALVALVAGGMMR
jgi:hypothetical protein